MPNADMDVLARRRENLRKLCKDKFDSNRAELARTAVVHPNQVNLMLTDNTAIRRPMTENLARKIERNLSLPEGYFDQAPSNGTHAGPVGALVIAPTVLPELSPVLSTSTGLTSITVSPEWLKHNHVNDAAKLWLADVACDGLEPDVPHGTAVVLESVFGQDEKPAPGKGFSRDGCYLLATKAGPILRRVQRRVDGFIISSPNPAYAPEPQTSLRSVIFYARVVGSLRFS